MGGSKFSSYNKEVRSNSNNVNNQKKKATLPFGERENIRLPK